MLDPSDPAHLAVALRVARKFGRSYPGLADEFESAAGLALCEACRTFDADGGMPPARYLANRVAGAMIDLLRHWRPKGYRRSVDAPAFVVQPLDAAADESGRTFADLLPSGDLPVGWAEDSADAVRGLARRLPPKHRAAVERLYTAAATPTMKAVGAATGRSESRVSQLLTQSASMLREHLSPTPPRREEPHPMPASNGHAPRFEVASAAGANPCPDCGHDRGARSRCFRCNPRRPPAPRAVAPASAIPAPVAAPPRPSPLEAEVAAMAVVASALAPLGEPARRRVLAWLAAYLEPAAP